MLDIPADAGAGHGLFDHLPDGMDGAEFAGALNRAATEVYGTPSRAFIEWLCADTEWATVAARRVQDQMLAELVPADADGQVKRAAGRFALVAAAGELAIHAGVIRELVEDFPKLAAIVEPLLTVRRVMRQQFAASILSS